MEYIIIPLFKEAMRLEGDSPEDAMAKFAARMDSDMNQYFRAITNAEYEGSVTVMAHKEQYLEFAMNEIKTNLIPDSDIEECIKAAVQIPGSNVRELTEEDIYEMAENGWDHYINDEDLTEYESFSIAFNEVYNSICDIVIAERRKQFIASAVEAIRKNPPLFVTEGDAGEEEIQKIAETAWTLFDDENDKMTESEALKLALGLRESIHDAVKNFK